MNIDKRVYDYRDLVIEKNKVMNLTNITDISEFNKRHIEDSLSIINKIELSGRVLDIGTGAGFPGIPLALYYKNLNFTLLDSQRKKLDFIKDSCRKLDIKNVTTIHSRAEDLARDKLHRELYDFVVTRAVASLSVLIELSIPFLKIGGKLVAYKGKSVFDEIKSSSNAFDKLNCMIENIIEYKINNIRYYIVIVKKESKTDIKYPRKAGTIKKSIL
ncbi:MAG: 16S rRNA (guanine(527)-N(7))-methyltransferase RsmG [Clostridiales bacterium]|nr:MAG: 16S rRNA (guanine(527)-N(7))-methyltransferase RsmG [Clostridiales bacterium]